jgi:hypothetical protein
MSRLPRPAVFGSLNACCLSLVRVINVC